MFRFHFQKRYFTHEELLEGGSLAGGSAVQTNLPGLGHRSIATLRSLKNPTPPAPIMSEYRAPFLPETAQVEIIPTGQLQLVEATIATKT